MILAIDVGNTNTVIGVFCGDRLCAAYRVATSREKTDDEWGMLIMQLLKFSSIPTSEIAGIILSSVVPPVITVFEKMARKYFGCTADVVGPGTKTGMAIKYENPKEVGADRIVNAVAAYELYGGPLVIVDFGTATTFDVVDHDGAYIGGVIAPGVNLSLEALHMAAAALPHVDVARPAKAIGTNTVACMQSGVYWGYIGLVEVIVREVRRERDRPMKVIATGGLASLFAQGTELFDSIEDDLTMHGLVLINAYNKDAP